MRTNNKKFVNKRKFCFYCKESKSSDFTVGPDYRNTTLLKKFITERGKIVGKSRSGLCSTHQRELGTAVKRARHLALLQFSSHLQ